MRFPRLEGGIFGRNTPRITFLAGLILFVFTGCVFIFVFFMSGSSQKKTWQEENFSLLLREYDKMIPSITDFHGEIDALNKELDRLEKKAIGVESWLSILKRRRNLTRLYHPSMEAYHRSTERAVKAYPWSQPLAALAAAAIVKDRALDKKAEKEARALLHSLSDPVFNDLVLGFHVILGDFNTPEKAAALPVGLVSDGTEEITFDLAILKILNNNARGAAADIQITLNSVVPPTGNFLRFAAEYYYDFGDPRRSAELFSRIETEEALLRQADALWLAGFADSARSIWMLLAEMPAPLSEANSLSLYNMASTAKNRDEAFAFLEKLSRKGISGTDSRQYGLIRYSRLLEDEQAIGVLESVEQLKPAEHPFLDLEIQKRSASQRPLGRQLAETWLLLDRHPDNVSLYHWAAWFVFYQRFYGEASILFKRVEQNRLAGQWAPIYTAICKMQEGALDAAESILRNITGTSNSENAEWPSFANLGLILEFKRSPARAIEQYELASVKTDNPQTASRIQLRIARSLTLLGRYGEALTALNRALELDPENLSARLEWERAMFR
jgi:tetratricopeptide (TPR) repeat protein